jgi:hypothetical protein
LVNQRGIYCTDPALMRFCTDFGRELDVGTQPLGDGMFKID